jgi:hypothetical protein
MSVLLHLIKWQLGLAGPETWTTLEERACLARHAAGKRLLAEIGVWHGGSARELRAAMAPGATLFAVDPYLPGRFGVSIPRIVGMRELRRSTNGTVVWLRMTGADAARSEPVRQMAPLDFVFVDAAQTYEGLRREWEAWSPLIGRDGIIALHDSRPVAGPMGRQSSVRFALQHVGSDPRFEIVDTVDSLTVLRRRANA